MTRGGWKLQQDEKVWQTHVAHSSVSHVAAVLGAAVRTWHSGLLRSTVHRIQEDAVVTLAFDRIPSSAALTQRRE